MLKTVKILLIQISCKLLHILLCRFQVTHIYKASLLRKLPVKKEKIKGRWRFVRFCKTKGQLCRKTLSKRLLRIRR